MVCRIFLLFLCNSISAQNFVFKEYKTPKEKAAVALCAYNYLREVKNISLNQKSLQPFYETDFKTFVIVMKGEKYKAGAFMSMYDTVLALYKGFVLGTKSGFFLLKTLLEKYPHVSTIEIPYLKTNTGVLQRLQEIFPNASCGKQPFESSKYQYIHIPVDDILSRGDFHFQALKSE